MSVDYTNWSDQQQSQAKTAELRSMLTSQPESKGGLLWLLVGLAVFVMTSGGQNLSTIAVVVGVVVIHELGHLAGMKYFGFSDLKMFFIPFFGAAASGRKFGASSFEHSVVLLLGPLPGIMLATVLFIAALRVPDAALAFPAFMLTLINVFNLLPVSPLDGGRLFERLIFNRRYWLEVFFRWATMISLVGLALLLRTWIFGLIAGFLLLTYPIHMRRVRAAFSLVSRVGLLPNNPADLTDYQAEELLASVEESMRGTKGTPQTLATLRTQAAQLIFDRASSPPATPAQVFICLAAWFTGWFLSILNLVLWAVQQHHARPL